MARLIPGLRYLAARACLAALTLFVISAVTFAATNAIPSDPARVVLGEFATPAQLAAFRKEQGLDTPVLVRYVDWLGHAVEGNFGYSIFQATQSGVTRTDVGSEIAGPLERSAVLSLCALLLAIPLAYAVGVYAGQRSGTRRDTFVSVIALLVNSQPEFVVALAALFVFAVWLKILPVESSGAVLGSGFTQVKAYFLPVITLAVVLTPYILRMVRANVRDVLRQPFVRTAVLRGVPRRRVIWRHVVPNASAPVVNVVALTMAELIGGVVIIESVFGFPGVGALLVTAVSARDTPVVQALALIIGAGFVTFNFLADAFIVLLNPRLRSA